MLETVPQASVVPPGKPKIVKPKIGKNVLSCAVLGLLFLVPVLAGAAYLVARSGFVDVPYFSKWYEVPKPTRAVKAKVMDADTLRVLLSQRLQDEVVDGKSPPYALRVDERELTGVMVDGMDKEGITRAWRPKNIQVAVLKDGVEISGRVEDGPFHLDFVALLVPSVKDGVLRVGLGRTQVGDFSVPASIADKLMGNILGRDLASWNLSLGKDVLKRIDLHDGYLEIVTAIPS